MINRLSEFGFIKGYNIELIRNRHFLPFFYFFGFVVAKCDLVRDVGVIAAYVNN